MASNHRELNRMHWSRKLLIGLATCVCLAIFMVTQWCFGPYREFTLKRLIVVFAHYFVVCNTWALLAIGINRLVVATGFDRKRPVRTLGIYLFAGSLFSMLFLALSWYPLRAIEYVSYGIERDPPTTFELVASLNSGLVSFAMIAGGCFAFHYVRRQRERELNTARLETQLAGARLDALKSQLQPHFLFNSLNTITSLIRANPEQADEMVVQLGDLLRSMLDNGKLDEVSVSEEIEFVQRYLEIEKMRFGERLTVEYRIDDEIGNVLIPNLLLQPLIENCIRHGVARVSRELAISVTAMQSGQWLILEVSDTGPGIATNGKTDGGIGLANTRERLQHLYGEKYRFFAGNRETGSGFCVNIEIPRQLPGAGMESET